MARDIIERWKASA